MLTRLFKTILTPENVACDRVFIRPARQSDVMREDNSDMWSVMCSTRSLIPGENIDLRERNLKDSVHRGSVLVAEKNGKIIGFGIADEMGLNQRKEMCVLSLLISPDENQGEIINALITGFAKKSRAQGFETLLVFHAKDNPDLDAVCSGYDATDLTFVDHTDSDFYAYKINNLTEKFGKKCSNEDKIASNPVTKPKAP